MIRTADTKDIPSLVELINLAYRVEDFFIDGNRTHHEQVSELKNNGDFLVFEKNKTIIGSVYVNIQERRGYFGMLAVNPKEQQAGIGKQLIQACEEYCLKRDGLFLDLCIASPREELPSYYQRLGFMPFDIRPFPETHKLKQNAHMVYFTKPLVKLF